MKGIREIVVAGAVLVVVIACSSPAIAKGSELTPVRDRYEPGDVATLVGYTGGPQLRAHRPPGPYRAFLEDEEGRLKIEVGQLELTDTGRRGWESLRVIARFPISAHLPPGHYRLTYCTDTCQLPLLGDITGGLLSVGVDPPYPWSHLWPLDEAEIGNLPDHAILTGPGYQTTAGDVRAGRIPVVPSGPPGAAAPIAGDEPPTVTAAVSTLPAATLHPDAAASLPDAPEVARSDDASWSGWIVLTFVAVAVAVIGGPALRTRRRQRVRGRSTASNPAVRSGREHARLR